MKKLISFVMAALLAVPLFAETFMVTKQVSQVASELSWVASTDADNHSYVNFQLDKVVNVSCKAANNGVYWENTTDATKSDWRMYQAREKGEFNIRVAIGYQLKSITLTYSSKNTGVVGLVSGSSIADANQVKSNTKLSLNPRTFSKTLYVANSGTLTNGQARITKFSVEYESVPVDTLYLNTGGSGLWNQAGAKFSAYYWNDGEEGQFTDFLELAYGETDIYRAIVPHSDSVIFVRHDAVADVPTWKNKWNQTDGEKVDLEDNGNIMIITGWNQGDFEWDQYTPKEPEPIKIFAKNSWDNADPTNWTWKEMTKGEGSVYTLENVVYGGTGLNINTKEDGDQALWIVEADFAGDKIQTKDTVTFAFDLSDSTLTATLIGRPVVPEATYYLVGDYCGWKHDTTAIKTFAKVNDTLTVTVDSLFGGIKVTEGKGWTKNFGAYDAPYELHVGASPYGMLEGGENFIFDADYKNAVFQIFMAPKGEGEALHIRFVSGEKVEKPQPAVQIFAKNKWEGGDWSWKEMKHDSTKIYSLDSVVYGGVGININTKEDDSEALWFDATKMAYTADTIKENDTVKIVFNLADSTLTATLLSRPVPPCVDNFGLMIDGSYVPGVYNETSSEWTVLKQDLIAGQKLTMYSYCGETSFAPKQGNFADFFDVNGDTLTVKEDAEYDFYIQLITGNDKLWVVQRKSVTLPRITKAPKSWAGEYAITAMTNDTAIVWTGIDAAQCRDSIKLVDGNLVAQDPVMVVVEAMKDGGYSVKMKGGANDGKYITQNATPSYGNGLKFVDSPVRVDITMNDSLVDFFQTIGSQKVYFLYNNVKGTSNERFRFYKDNNYDKYTKLTLFGTPAPSYDYDTVMYVAGNFTNWAEGMRVLPDTVTMPEDSVLAFKQVRVITTKLGETVVKTDTAWFGQQNEGAYMTRENSKDGWTLDGAYDVLLLTDRAGDYVFSLEGESFKVKFPALPGYTYDTLYTIAGNFTNWQYDMQAMPYEVKNVAKDSVLEYQVVRQLITYETGVETKRDTTWLGQPNEGNQMTRDNNAWKLDGGYNVKLTADEDGTYTFDFTPNDSVLTVTFPALKPHLDEVNTIAHLKACYEAGTLKDNDTIKVKGYIASMFLKPSNFAKYGSVTIWMTDTLGGKAKEFQLYNCYGLEKDTFVYFGPDYNTTGKSSIDVDTIIGRNNVRFVVGDYVEAVGAFKNFSGTFELVQGCNIYEGGEEMVRFAKNSWDSEDPTNWTWKDMTYVPQQNQFELNNVVYGGTGVNINTVADDADALWIPEADFLGDKIQAKDTVSFVFNPSDSTLTATLIGRPAEPATPSYGIKVNGTYYAGEPKDIVGGKEYKVDIALVADDEVQLFDSINNAGWIVEPEAESYSDFTKDYANQKYVITNAGQYQFYVKIYTDATSGLYVAYQAPTAINDVFGGKDQIKKMMKDNQIIIIRNGVMYNVTGARIK